MSIATSWENVRIFKEISCVMSYLSAEQGRKMFSANQLICLHCQITKQKTQKTIENEHKMTFHLGRMYRTSHRAFAVEKNSSHRKPVWQVVFRFSLEIFTLSGSRHNFLKFYRFPSQNIVVKWRYLLL